ncbi:unnamed protein product [Paramecium octaurelia]|uniref:Uncharacterized protein n=1 Tax=Paramecium octaurelia TaxID=43137 RepID=A0A8S1T501_PAROT|nr:unnamed protein product [Paramecium octaurelia]
MFNILMRNKLGLIVVKRNYEEETKLRDIGEIEKELIKGEQNEDLFIFNDIERRLEYYVGNEDFIKLYLRLTWDYETETKTSTLEECEIKERILSYKSTKVLKELSFIKVEEDQLKIRIPLQLWYSLTKGKHLKDQQQYQDCMKWAIDILRVFTREGTGEGLRQLVDTFKTYQPTREQLDHQQILSFFPTYTIPFQSPDQIIISIKREI